MSSTCKICEYEQETGTTLDQAKTIAALSRETGLAETTIRRHFARLKGHVACPAGRPEKPETLDKTTGKATLTKDGGDFEDVQTEEPISDWSKIFERFKLDPEDFFIVGDTVRMSTWEQSKRTENGDRDVVQLYSYRASFKRKTQAVITEEDLQAAREHVRSWTINRRIPGASFKEPVAQVLNLADMQLAKSEGGGIQETLTRIYDGLERFAAETKRQRRDKNVNEIILVNNGDPFEGIAGNYAAQAFTVQATLREQMNLVLDVWSSFARELFPDFDKAQFVSVLCNHTEFGRQGGASKSITSDSDNGSAFLAETLKRILEGREEFQHVEYTIPHDEMTVYTTAAGIPMGFNHGHKIPGNDATGFTKWLDGQARGDTAAWEALVWVTAHRHNFQVWDLGSASVFSCPSCDGGSKWLRDTTGKYSRSGIISFLVGQHHRLGWSDLAFL